MTNRLILLERDVIASTRTPARAARPALTRARAPVAKASALGNASPQLLHRLAGGPRRARAFSTTPVPWSGTFRLEYRVVNGHTTFRTTTSSIVVDIDSSWDLPFRPPGWSPPSTFSVSLVEKGVLVDSDIATASYAVGHGSHTFSGLSTSEEYFLRIWLVHNLPNDSDRSTPKIALDGSVSVHT